MINVLDHILRYMGKYRYLITAVCVVAFFHQKAIPLHSSLLSIIAGVLFCLHAICLRHIIVNRVSLSKTAIRLAFVLPSTIYPVYFYQFLSVDKIVLIVTFLTGVAILNQVDAMFRELKNGRTPNR